MTTKTPKKNITALTKAVFKLVEGTFEEVPDDFEEKLRTLIKSHVRKLTKKRKDPNAPPGVRNAFIWFSTAHRKELMKEEVKDENGKLRPIKITEISKILGKRWRKLSDEEKVPYKEKAQEDKERYEKAMKRYKETSESDSDTEAKEEKKKTKRAPTAYMVFCKEQRPLIKEDPDLTSTERRQELSRRWAEEKAKKVKKAKKVAKKVKKVKKVKKARGRKARGRKAQEEVEEEEEVEDESGDSGGE